MKRALRRWLLRSLKPCRQMIPLMSESMDRSIGRWKSFELKLHLLVCTWCARYLEQLKFLRQLLHQKSSHR